MVLPTPITSYWFIQWMAQPPFEQLWHEIHSFDYNSDCCNNEIIGPLSYQRSWHTPALTVEQSRTENSATQSMGTSLWWYKSVNNEKETQSKNPCTKLKNSYIAQGIKKHTQKDQKRLQNDLKTKQRSDLGEGVVDSSPFKVWRQFKHQWVLFFWIWPSGILVMSLDITQKSTVVELM